MTNDKKTLTSEEMKIQVENESLNVEKEEEAKGLNPVQPDHGLWCDNGCSSAQ